MKRKKFRNGSQWANSNRKHNSQKNVEGNQTSPQSDNHSNENQEETSFEATEQFAQFAHLAFNSKEDTSMIPEEVYENLPEILKKCCVVFNDPREKDVFLTGALGVFSGLFNTIKGLYRSDESFSNLMFFIVSPPANGKGAMKYAKMLGYLIHKIKVENSKKEWDKYKKQMQNSKNKYLPEPTQSLLYIPANSSASAVIRHLKENNENGIVFETEADTLANTFKQDWGGYSDLIRNAFQHENVTYSRKKDREFIELQQPKLSLILSGTPDQVKSLIQSTENGLFSRITFYVFEGTDLWRNAAPNANRINFKKYFEEIGIEVNTIYDTYSSKQFNFDLTERQWNALDSQFSNWLNEITTFVHKDTSSIIKRLGLVQFRLAMILAILRHYEEGNQSTNIICSNRDFKSAQLLSDIYLEHGLTMFSKLPREHKMTLNDFKKRFYDLLPKDQVFSRAEAVEIGISTGLKERAVGNYLQRFLNINLLFQPEYGKYKKT